MNKMIRIDLFFLVVVFLSSLQQYESAPQSNLVTSLPGFNDKFLSKHYAGYLTVNENKTKNLYYYFVVSERKPAEDPVVLWLNGGPGCSSFDGFVYEHGPFNFEAGKSGGLPKLHINPYSWSKVSNIIYLDSPVGVGYSYSKNAEDYTTGDLQTASDTHTFLLKWFEQYPEFKSNPFYIAGESYAGVYVPTLASKVVEGNENANSLETKLNFKGYMVGNGVADQKFDGEALIPFAHGMGLISDDLFHDVKAECNGTMFELTTSKKCNDQLYRINDAIQDLNIYDILEPCYHSPSATSSNVKKGLPASFKQLGATSRPLPVRTRMFGRAWPYRAPVKEGKVPTWPELHKQLDNANVPCFDDSVATIWLNDDTVREALHAQVGSVAGRWDLCTDRIDFTHDAGSMIPYHKNLTQKGYRALIYSGDHDMCIPYTGTQAWTRSLGHKIIDEWRPWLVNGEVVGFTQGYDNNLTFLTIKGAGHTVPEYKPQEALAFYRRFLEGKVI